MNRRQQFFGDAVVLASHRFTLLSFAASSSESRWRAFAEFRLADGDQTMGPVGDGCEIAAGVGGAAMPVVDRVGS